MENEIEVVASTKRDAASSALQYIEPTDLRNNSKTRITAIPRFITHNTKEVQGVTIKIDTYGKQGIERFNPLKSLSLSEDETRKLYELLIQSFQLAKNAAPGDYITIKAIDGTADLGNINPKEVASALIKVLSKSEIVHHLQDIEISAELVSALQSKIRFCEMEQALDTLEELLNTETRENYFQKWCEAHSWAFGNAYIVNDRIRAISAGDSVDLLLPRVFGGMRDLVELKRPDMNVLLYDEAHTNYYFGNDVSKAIGQCHRYLDVFSEEARKGLRDYPEIYAYHPCATLIIGHSHDWKKQKYEALHGLNSRLSGITIMTYDQLLQQGRQILKTFTNTNTSENPASVFKGDIPL